MFTSFKSLNLIIRLVSRAKSVFWLKKSTYLFIWEIDDFPSRKKYLYTYPFTNETCLGFLFWKLLLYHLSFFHPFSVFSFIIQLFMGMKVCILLLLFLSFSRFCYWCLWRSGKTPSSFKDNECSCVNRNKIK